MQIAIIRHAVAESREQFGKTGRPDAERPLTPDGRAKMRKAARGLASWLDGFDLVATSPYTRARATAEIVSDAYGGLELADWPELEPDVKPARVLGRIGTVVQLRRIALVTHRPLAPKLVAWLLTGGSGPAIDLKKGAVCLLDLPERVAAGQAVLVASLPPALLRKLAG